MWQSKNVSNNGVFPKWSRILQIQGNWWITEAWIGLNLKIWLSHVSSWHCGNMLFSHTRGGYVRGSNPFNVIKYFCHWIHRIHWKHLGKTPMTRISLSISGPQASFSLPDNLSVPYTTLPLIPQSSKSIWHPMAFVVWLSDSIFPQGVWLVSFDFFTYKQSWQ